MKPICVPCQRFYRMKRSGFYFVEAMPKNNLLPRAGTESPHEWKPYKLWAGDLWECKGCGAQLVSGCGMKPIAEHYEPDFARAVKSFGAEQLQVNDC